jgi:uncharacterized protein (DUF58 family)
LILPTLRLACVAGLAALCLGTLSGLGVSGAGLWILAVLPLLAAILDAAWMPRPRELSATRELPDRLAMGVPNTVRLRVANRATAPVAVLVGDSVPLSLMPDAERVRIVVRGNAEGEGGYTVTPPARGEYRFGSLGVRWFGPLGLVARQMRVPAEVMARVYPRYVDYGRFVLESRIKIRREGPHRRRAAQRAEEFESLREYVPGDDTRRIDWKATARARRLIVRNYEEERSKDVMLLIDAGRAMASQAGGLTKLDQAINAALMVASVGLERKDKVGLLAFGAEPRAFLLPAPGRDQVRLILDALCNLQVELSEPDFGSAFAHLRSKHRKRSFVILFTDLIDREVSSQLLAHVAALAQRHLVLCITIRDQSLENAATAGLDTVDAVYTRAVAEDVLRDRGVAIAELRHRGVVVMDVAPDELTVAATNRYIAMRSSGQV